MLAILTRRLLRIINLQYRMCADCFIELLQRIGHALAGAQADSCQLDLILFVELRCVGHPVACLQVWMLERRFNMLPRPLRLRRSAHKRLLLSAAASLFALLSLPALEPFQHLPLRPSLLFWGPTMRSARRSCDTLVVCRSWTNVPLAAHRQSHASVHPRAPP